MLNIYYPKSGKLKKIIILTRYGKLQIKTIITHIPSRWGEEGLGHDALLTCQVRRGG